MSYDLALGLLLFALVVGGLFSLFMLLVNLQYSVHRRIRFRLREIARDLGLEYHDRVGDLDQAVIGFRRRLRLREVEWSVSGYFKDHEVILQPTPDIPEQAVEYALRGRNGDWVSRGRPRAPMHDEEVEVILDELLADGAEQPVRPDDQKN